MQGDIKQAIEILKQGGIVIFPTDTAFGIGCRIDNEKAVARLFEIRKRPPIQPTPVLVGSVKMAQEYLLSIPDDVKEKLVKKYWPGALTIVLKCQTEKIPTLVRGGGETLGVRMPDHETALTLIHGVGMPILGPSANFHGEKTPFRFEELEEELIGQVDYVVKGACKQQQASTVIDCTQNPWKILRQGAIEIKF